MRANAPFHAHIYYSEKDRAAGVEVPKVESQEGVGRFARIHDPDGNPIELWEPPAG